MKRPLLVPTVLLLAALGLAAGCGDDGDSAETGDAPDTETTTEAPPEDEGDADDDGEGDGDAGACAEAAAAASPDEARTAFPDNPDVTWAVLGTREGGLGTVLVELEPDPDEVGYPSFTFVFSCGSDTPERLATYALDGDEYVLLATTDAAEGIDFAPVLDE